MSAILNKKGPFFTKIFAIFKKGGSFVLSIQYFKNRQHLGSISTLGQSAFCRKRVSFESSKVSILKNRGLFFGEKVSGKG